MQLVPKYQMVVSTPKASMEADSGSPQPKRAL